MNECRIIKEGMFRKSFNIKFGIKFFVYVCMYLLIVVMGRYSK